MAPADGKKKLVARGQVVRPGRTLIVTRAEVFAIKDGREIPCALMQQTIMVMEDKAEKQARDPCVIPPGGRSARQARGGFSRSARP